MKYCPNCSAEIMGRADKIYCSLICKNNYNWLRKQETKTSVKLIDTILHRNRIILINLMGDSSKDTIDKMVLTKAKFRWEYHTGHYVNKEGKTYWQVYDFAWMDFSDQKVLIVKKAGGLLPNINKEFFAQTL